jgi:hypothetical protein
MRFRLGTLLILLAVGPPVLAWFAGPAIEHLIWPPANVESVLLMEVNFNLVKENEPTQIELPTP